MTETTKEKSASPGQGVTDQITADSASNHTRFATLGKVDWLDVAVSLCFAATGALLGSLL